MTEDKAKNLRLKKFVREQVRDALLKTGRKLVIDKGPEFLTARKLSEASNTSVGTIYNTFATMEDFICAENVITLKELTTALKVIIPEENPYVNLNRYADVFSSFVCNNRNLWMLLYREQLVAPIGGKVQAYKQQICRMETLIDKQAQVMFERLNKAERRAALRVLEMALFAISGFLTGESTKRIRGVNKDNICKLLLNTYLAGLASLKR